MTKQSTTDPRTATSSTPGTIDFVPSDPGDHWAAIGQIASVFGDSPEYRDLPLQAFFAKIIPATSLGQYTIGRRAITVPLGGERKRVDIPVAVILWAKVSDAVDESFFAATSPPIVHPQDWNSGENFWFLEAVGLETELVPLARQLRQRQFRGRPYKMFVHDDKQGFSAREIR